MRRFRNIISCAAAVVFSVLGVISCIDTPHRGGGGLDPDKPNRPGEGDGDCTVEFLGGFGEFYGTYYSDKTDNFLIYLYEGDTDSQGNFTGSATFLTLDILVPHKGELTLPSGEYNCSDWGDAYTFIPGWGNTTADGVPFLDGSKISIKKGTAMFVDHAISTGSIAVYPLITGQYEIKGNVVAEGREYSLHFKGKIEISDKTETQGEGEGEGGEEEGDVPKNVEMKNITSVVAEDWGMIWDGIPCTSYRDYILYFKDKDAENTQEYTCVEILTEERYRKSLPDATFNKVVAVGSPNDFVPGVIIAGYSDEDNYAWGTWYCKGGTAWYAASKGSMEIKATDKGFKIDFAFVDEDETYGGTFKGSYEGKVEFVETETKAFGIDRRPAGVVRRQKSRHTALPKARL